MNGQLILHYSVLDQLGAGGMGVVYRAVDTRLGRMVALKFLPESASLDTAAKERLIGEARAAAKLDHPNIGVIYSIEDVEQRPFIVMALYQGQDLRARMADGPSSISDALDITIQTAQGLARAHDSGIVHRDIKPENLFITDQKLVKILDFGLAKHDEISGLTNQGAIMGTLPYMSPEQVRGQAVDHRTDLWSLGVVLYEMLSGISPFIAEGGMAAAILKIIKDEPQSISELRADVSRRIEDILERVLAKDLDYRYSSAQELVADLEAAKATGTASAGYAPPPFPTRVAEPAPQVQPQAPPPQAVPTPSVPASVLPTPSTPLVGRQDELAIIATHLEDPHCRILTLFGPGGTGKTRLVLEAARKQLEGGRYKDGVFFVPLDILNDADLIPGAIAKVLAMMPQGQEPILEQVGRHIGARSVLLVLDNYEHVMDGAQFPADLVQTCPNLKILVTSRERLSLDEEWVLPIFGLGVPEMETVTAEKAQRYDSVQLFVHRAKRASLHFSLEDENPADVCRICQLVDGSPLAIELAAAWVKMMPCAEIIKEIQANLDFLASSSRNITERHRSIRATFEYSWCLLTPKEQEALRKLSVFSGGFKREAASEVAGTSLPILASLVDKSLLRSSNGRYDSHPLLHQYTREKLAENSQEQLQVEEKHSQYYLRFLQQSVGQKDELEKLDVEMGNVLTAMQAASRIGNDVVLVEMMRLLAVDGAYYTARGHTPRSLELLKVAIEAAKKLGDLNLAQGLISKLGNAYRFFLGDFDRAVGAYQEALELAQALNDHHREVILLGVMGHTSFHQGRSDADDYLERAYQLAKAHDDDLALSHALNNKGYVASLREDWKQAHQFFSDSIEVTKKLKNDPHVNQLEVDYHLFTTLLNLGEAERMLGSFDKALSLRQQALQIAQEQKNQIWTAYALQEIGDMYHSVNERELAQGSYDNALMLYRRNSAIADIDKLTAFMEVEGYSLTEITK